MTKLNSEDEILNQWQPEPLVPEIEVDKFAHLINPPVVSSRAGKHITVNGVKCLNLATHNYLGLADDPRLEAAALEATHKYGCGSCGPRGFYGTMDVHLKLEEELASFLQVQEAVLYSYGFSTIASAIPAYAKASDYVYVDELCNFAIQQGIVASRSKVLKFRHNDTKHLEELIEQVEEEQRKKFGKPNKVRSFIIVESVYAKSGDLCPLVEIVRLKRQHKIRLFIDESHSFGTLGETGKGITEHLKVNIHDVDLMMASLEFATCAYGGFCAGSTYIIDHQRLAGTGYCFSASLPPFQARVALESLRMICEYPNLIKQAQDLYQYAHESLKTLNFLHDTSYPLSPIKILNVQTEDKSFQEQKSFLQKIHDTLLKEEQIAISLVHYLEDEEMTRPKPALRLVVGGSLERVDIDRVITAIELCCQRYK